MVMFPVGRYGLLTGSPDPSGFVFHPIKVTGWQKASRSPIYYKRDANMKGVMVDVPRAAPTAVSTASAIRAFFALGMEPSSRIIPDSPAQRW